MKHCALSAMMLIGVAHAGPFGRFGFTAIPDVPAFKIGPDGFQINHPQADRLTWPTKSKIWKPVGVSEFGETILLSGLGQNPLKIRIDLLSPGFLIYVQRGLNLRLTTTRSPYLSWHGGSVGSGVPTPAVPWALVSFRDSQPPLMFGFIDGPAEVEISGRSGDWTLKTIKPYRGWIRVCAPTGTQPRPTNGAAALGALSQELKPFNDIWTAPPPKLLKTEISEEATAVTATWTFDRPGFVIPRALTLANIANYRASILSKTKRLTGYDELGPIDISLDAELKARLPVAKVEHGLSLPNGSPKNEPLATASPLDVPSVVEVALANLLSSRDVSLIDLARECSESYFENQPSIKEPTTQQILPYLEDGTNLDLTAAHALLMHIRHATISAEDQANGLLTSVLWRRDWLTWTLTAPDRDKGRRATALAAIASALNGAPQSRLDAAMLAAGLFYERALGIWMARKGMPSQKLLDPMPSLIQALFMNDGPGEPDLVDAKALVSPLRIYASTSVHLNEDVLSWNSTKGEAQSFILTGGIEEAVPVANIQTLAIAHIPGAIIIDAQPKSPAHTAIKLSPTMPNLPKLARWPGYRELKR